MTEQNPVNPPAFPTTPVRVDGVLDADCYHGMTQRDYFAAAALQGWMASYAPHDSHPSGEDAHPVWKENIAKASYRMADAMLRARAA